VRKLASDIKGGTMTKDVLKQDVAKNIGNKERK
jgi:hypothetical protein